MAEAGILARVPRCNGPSSTVPSGSIYRDYHPFPGSYCVLLRTFVSTFVSWIRMGVCVGGLVSLVDQFNLSFGVVCACGHP